MDLRGKVMRAIASAVPDSLDPPVPAAFEEAARTRVCAVLSHLQTSGAIENWTLLEMSRESVHIRIQESFAPRYEEFRFGLRELHKTLVVMDVMES